MTNNHTVFDEPHYQSLEVLAAQALADGDFASAYKLADRRCRILPIPDPHCYVLRGEAFFQMGAKGKAISDLVKALEIAPDTISANRRLFLWASGTPKIQAASALIRQERNFDTLRKAIEVLKENGRQRFANVKVFEETIEGWAVWKDDAPLEISISDGTYSISITVQPDPFHALADKGHAASFNIQRPKSTSAQSILLSASGNVFYSTRTASNESEPNLKVRWPQPTNAHDESVTVIVPVYGDYEATRQCLESLLPELRSTRHRAIAVNDATPDPHIAKYLASLATEPRVDVLVNAKNLGFIGSVNRALKQASHGDVILLNSDTIVPRGFIDRLATAAKSSADIGTVTPLSNNGEFVSFPIPNTANPLSSRDEIQRIDFIAATANAHRVVDIPTGVGFCLYITRACLNAVGLFCEDFDSGYLEDADFCLRAREYGFRSVCAPSVYVAHAGSKSYRQEKRSLVVRNLGVLEHRFPQHRRECAAFMAADPLRKSREAIERAAVATTRHPRLLVTASGVTGTIARNRARACASDPQPAMVAEVRRYADGTNVNIFDAAGCIPQSIRFDLSMLRERESLADFVRNMQPSQVEILDPAGLPFPLVEILLKLGVPYDVFISDGSLLGQNNARLSIAAVPPSEISKTRGAPQGQVAPQPREDWRGHWQQILDGAQRILVPCAQAEAFAANILPKHIIRKIERSADTRRRHNHRRQMATVGQLGLVPVRSCAQEQWLMNEIACSFARTRRDVSITVIGATLDDIKLMQSGNTFVTGSVSAEELEDVVNALGLGFLFISTTSPLFGHPIQSVVFSSSLPVAYFDWSAGRIKPKKKDLPLDPNSSIADVMDRLNRWIPKL